MGNKKNEPLRGKKDSENIKTRATMLIKTIIVCDISSHIK